MHNRVVFGAFVIAVYLYITTDFTADFTTDFTTESRCLCLFMRAYRYAPYKNTKGEKKDLKWGKKTCKRRPYIKKKACGHIYMRPAKQQRGGKWPEYSTCNNSLKYLSICTCVCALEKKRPNISACCMCQHAWGLLHVSTCMCQHACVNMHEASTLRPWWWKTKAATPNQTGLGCTMKN